MKPYVSVIIPVYNGANYLAEAIDSVLNQTYKNFEIIVINDGSSDSGATKKVAESYGNMIRYYEKENGGVSSALNFGIKVMKGEYFSWLSHDDIYYSEKLEREVDVLRNGDEIVYSGWDYLIMPNRDIISYTSDLYQKIIPKNIRETGACLSFLRLVSGCSLLIPKSLFKVYGGFDEKYRAVQDYKLWFEMFRGKRVVFIPDSLIQSRVHMEQVTYKYEKCDEEEEWLYSWMLEKIKSEDIDGSGFSFYQILCIYAQKLYDDNMINVAQKVIDRIKQLQQPDDIDCKIISFCNKYNINRRDGVYLFCAGKRGIKLAMSLLLRKIKIAAFLDNDKRKIGKKYHGVFCVDIKNIPKGSTIIVTKKNPDDIVIDLAAQERFSVFSYDDIAEDLFCLPAYKEEIINLV